MAPPESRRTHWQPPGRTDGLRGLGAVLLAAILVVGACGGAGGTGSPVPGASGSPNTVPPSASGGPSDGSSGSPAASAVAPSPSLAEGEFQNPVIDRNYADPFVLRVDDTYYAYATGDLTYNIQVSTSPDLVDWTPRKEALPRLPFWQPSAKGLTWAPEVVETSAGFVLHYTARDVQAGRQCLAVAVADDPAGPFVDESDEPLLCQLDLGGSIDSSPFQDEDGQRYLLWKSDGNCCGIPVRFFIQPLSDDGLTLEGEVTRIEGITVDAGWERTLVEAPTLWLHEGTYYLFFSANDYNSRNYAVGYATATELLGPYTDAPENPILATQVEFGSPPGSPAGPGHQSIVADDDGDLWLAYHAWDSGLIGDQVGGRRAMWIDELRFEDGRAIVDGPDVGPQPRP
jgi:beta-xylosidase